MGQRARRGPSRNEDRSAENQESQGRESFLESHVEQDIKSSSLPLRCSRLRRLKAMPPSSRKRLFRFDYTRSGSLLARLRRLLLLPGGPPLPYLLAQLFPLLWRQHGVNLLHAGSMNRANLGLLVCIG